VFESLVLVKYIPTHAYISIHAYIDHKATTNPGFVISIKSVTEHSPIK